jgi:hypothetical protein
MIPLTLVTVAFAAAPSWTTSGDVRLVGTVPPVLALDPDGGMLTQGPVFDQRFRLGAVAAWPTWKLVGEADLFTGQVAGDTWNIDGETDERGRHAIDAISPAGFALRQGYVNGRLGLVDVAMGAQTSSWGLGMVANDGTTPRLFGRDDFGDRVLRLRVATRPGQAKADAARTDSTASSPAPLTLVAAVDRVIADDSARWALDQAAYQAVLAGLWTDGLSRRGGLYLVGRHQTENASGDEIDQRVTKVVVADAFADVSRVVGDTGGRVRLACEGAFVVGSTDRSQSYAATDGLRVRSGGLALVTAFTPDEGTTTLHLRGGWASADGNPDDDTTHTFNFDRDYGVGMVLFPEVKGAIEAATYARIEDTANAGQAPEGADQTVTEGAFGGATYLQPALAWRALPLVELRYGAVLAWSNNIVQSPFETARNGGVPTNHLGEPTSGYYLGSEWDWAVELGRQAPPTGAPPDALVLWPTLSVSGGHALLSEDMGGGRADLFMVRGKLTW